MPFVPNNLVAQAALQFTWDGQKVENVLHFLATTDWTDAMLDALTLALGTWWTTTIGAGFAPNTVHFDGISARSLANGSDPTRYRVANVNATGTSPSLPNSVTLAISLRTAFAGRSYRGRIFHIGLAENQVVGNTMDAGANTGLVSYYKELIDGTVSLPGQLCIYSRFLGGVARTLGVATPVIGVTSDGIIDNMRRRLPGRGR